mmetsp:Transcript_7957/g.18420  ORF Transcript_7957/g.18420 Transcript_7957/m.18420 type:complete len:201 (+) Transcript_7957:45-647(+)
MTGNTTYGVTPRPGWSKDTRHSRRSRQKGPPTRGPDTHHRAVLAPVVSDLEIRGASFPRAVEAARAGDPPAVTFCVARVGTGWWLGSLLISPSGAAPPPLFGMARCLWSRADSWTGSPGMRATRRNSSPRPAILLRRYWALRGTSSIASPSSSSLISGARGCRYMGAVSFCCSSSSLSSASSRSDPSRSKSFWSSSSLRM